MPTVTENKNVWDGDYNWKNSGDEWSSSWGSSTMQWYGTLLPRIHAFVPCGRIVEIACGHGRWTHFLRNLADSLIAVDLSEQCVNACRQRFADDARVECHTTDGMTLPMVAERSADLVFSFDSLVHVDDQVMNGYLRELERILADDGVAFLHHSNLAGAMREESRVFRKLRTMLRRSAVMKQEDVYWRDGRVDAVLVAQQADTLGLRCISQEIFPWATNKRMLDCISVVVRKDSRFDREPRFLRNPHFTREGEACRSLGHLYAIG